jgi:metallo-beta-lactamase class B
MSKPLIFLAAALLGIVLCPPCPAQPQPAKSPADSRSAGRILVSQDREAAQKLFASWRPAVPPGRIIGNLYYVGLSGVCSWLITTPEGHILIDTAFEDSVPQICRSIEQLGFRVEDIKWILSSHAHVDHVGGHAAMKRRTGARIVASAADAHVMETGGADDFSPFPRDLLAYTPVMADRIVRDGDAVSLGGVTLTAHLTPGHTKGATTWTMTVTEGARNRSVVFFSSVSLVPPTRLLNNPNYPSIVDDYRATFKKLQDLPCDIFLAPHGDQFGLAGKLERLKPDGTPNPFIDPEGWQRLIAGAERAFLSQLDAEKKGP